MKSVTTTLSAIVNGFEGDVSYNLYIIASGSIPLYVGKSKNAVARVLSHLGLGEWAGLYGSSFDRRLKTYEGWEDFAVVLLESNDPDEDEWVWIYELSPVFNAKGQKRTRENAERWFQLHPEPVIKMSRNSSVEVST